MRSLKQPRAMFVISLVLAGIIGLGAASTASHADEDDVVVSIQAKVEMETLLQEVGKALDKPLIWDPNDKQIRGKQVVGSVDIKTKREHLLGSVRSLLTFYELVMIPVGEPDHEILLVMDARRTTSILKLKALPIQLNDRNLDEFSGADGLYVTTMISAPHMVDMRNARNALTRVVTGQNIGNVTEVPDARSFIVTDFAPNVVAIYRLIKQMDSAAELRGEAAPTRRVFQAITLEHASAKSLVDNLLSLFPTPRTGPPGRTPQAVSSAPLGVRIQADERTNKVLVTGSLGEVEQVKGAVTLLDVPVYAKAGSVEVISLDHLQAYDAANEIQALIQYSPHSWGSPRPAVVASRGINAVLVTAGGDALQQIRQLIQEMDSLAGERKRDAANAAGTDK